MRTRRASAVCAWQNTHVSQYGTRVLCLSTPLSSKTRQTMHTAARESVARQETDRSHVWPRAGFRFGLPRLEHQAVEPRLVDREHVLWTTRGVDSAYTLFIVGKLKEILTDIAIRAYSYRISANDFAVSYVSWRRRRPQIPSSRAIGTGEPMSKRPAGCPLGRYDRWSFSTDRSQQNTLV